MATNITDETVITNENPSSTNADVNADNQVLSTDISTNSNQPVNASVESNVSEPVSSVTPDKKNTNNESEQVQIPSEIVNADADNKKEQQPPLSQTISPVSTADDSALNDEVKSEVLTTTKVNDLSANIFPPTPTNPIDEQEKFNNIARKSFSPPDSDNQIEINVPATNNTASNSSTIQTSTPVIISTDNINSSETIKPKKLPAPILKPSTDDSKKVQTPTDTVITLEQPTNATQTLTEDKGLINTEPELVSPPPPTTSDTKKQPKVVTSLLSTPALLGCVVTFCFAILQVIIGWTYADDCPIHWRIPHYLFIAGIIGLILVLLPFRGRIIRICLKPKPNENNTCFTLINTILGFAWIALSLFTFGWFIAGCVWVFRVYNKVTYTDPNQWSFCHPVLYRCAFWLLIFTSIIPLFQIFLCFMKTLRMMNVNRRKNGAYSAVIQKTESQQ